MGQANKWTRRNYFSGRKEDGKKEVNRNRVVKKWSSDHYENESGIKRNSRRCNFFFIVLFEKNRWRDASGHTRSCIHIRAAVNAKIMLNVNDFI